jgi:hypothetical protein
VQILHNANVVIANARMALLECVDALGLLRSLPATLQPLPGLYRTENGVCGLDRIKAFIVRGLIRFYAAAERRGP